MSLNRSRLPTWLILLAAATCLSIRLPAEEQLYTVESINDEEFGRSPPPPPARIEEYTFQVTTRRHEEAIPISSRNLRNLSVTIENRGKGLVKKPHLLGPRGWDFRSLEALAAAVTRGDGLTLEEKFIRIHEWKGLHVMNVLGGSYSPYNDDDFSGNPLRVLNQYGHAMCGQSINTINALLLAVPPAGSMFGRKVKMNAHRTGEAYFGGAWHAFDSTPGTGIVQWVYYDATGVNLAPTWKYLLARPDLVTQIKGWSGFSLQSYLSGATGETFDEKERFRAWDFRYDLRPGEKLTMNFDMRGRLDRTSARQDNSKSFRCYSDYGSATFTYQPDLTSSATLAFAEGQGNLQVSRGGLVPADPTKPAWIIFPVRSTWCFAGANIRARFKTSGKVSIAVNEDPFNVKLPASPAWQKLDEATEEYAGGAIEGLMAYWVRCEFQGIGSGLQQLEIASEVQMSPWSMPGLRHGMNRVVLEADDLGGSTLQVTYRYDPASPYHFYQPATGRYGRHIPIRVGGVLQQGSKKDTVDWRKGRFWDRLRTSLGESLPVRLEIYKVSGNNLGTKVRTLVNGPLPYGFHELYWNGRDDRGRILPVGMYAYKATFNSTVVHGERLYLYDEIWPLPAEVSEPPNEDPIVLVEAARALPSRVLVGQLLHLSLKSRSTTQDQLVTAWDLGDGRLTQGEFPLVGYARPGVYQVVGTVVDSKGHALRSACDVTVFSPESSGPDLVREGAGGGGGAEADHTLLVLSGDGGVPPPVDVETGADLEVDPEDSSSSATFDLSGLKSSVGRLAISRVRGRVWLAGRRGPGQLAPDSCRLEGTLPTLPAGWSPEGKQLVVDVGGARCEFVLDRRGRARVGSSWVQVRVPRKQGHFAGGTAAFRARLQGDLANEWVDEGLLGDSDEEGAQATFGVDVILDGVSHQAQVPTTLEATARHSARFRSAD